MKFRLFISLGISTKSTLSTVAEEKTEKESELLTLFACLFIILHNKSAVTGASSYFTIIRTNLVTTSVVDVAGTHWSVKWIYSLLKVFVEP